MPIRDIKVLLNILTTDQKVRVRILPYALEVGDATEPKAQSVDGPRICSEPADTVGKRPPDWLGDRVALRQHSDGFTVLAPDASHLRTDHGSYLPTAL